MLNAEELRAIRKRPVARGQAGQRRLSDAEKRALGEMIYDGKITVTQAAKRTRCHAGSLSRWSVEAGQRRADVALREAVAPIAKMDIADLYAAGAAAIAPKSEPNGNGHLPPIPMEFRLTQAQQDEAVKMWLRSKGVDVL